MGHSMIFPAKQAHAIARGTKTTHRTRPSMVWRPGCTIAVQAAARAEPVCHINVLAVTEATLANLTRQQAMVEGFAGARGPLNFKRAWLDRYDPAWIRARLGTEDDTGITDEDVVRRISERWLYSPILVVTIELADTPSLYLADVRGGQGDYTRNPGRAIDELACPPFVERLAEQARAEGERQRASFRRDLEEERKRQRNARGLRRRDAA